MRALICAGASCGHLNPALALARELKKISPDFRISFVSTRRAGLESQIREKGYEVFFVSARGWGSGLIKKFTAVCLLLASFWEAFFIIEKFRPDIIVGFGSYVSFPVLLEGAFFKKKTLIHEQNVSLGRANKILSLFVDKVALSVPLSRVEKSGKFIYTGNPLREDLNFRVRQEALNFFGFSGNKFTILVTGGSQGARGINRAFIRVAQRLRDGEGLQVIHITGPADYADLKDSYRKIRITHKIFEFLPQMDLAYSLADLVIARAGAATIAELAYFKKSAILIPYPGALGHQVENAGCLKNENAARVIEENNLDGDLLFNNARDLINSPQERGKLSENIAKFFDAKSVENLAKAVCRLCGK